MDKYLDKYLNKMLALSADVIWDCPNCLTSQPLTVN